jgi:hypothetical protein
MNEGNRMTVVVYCPTSSSIYEDRRSFRKQLKAVECIDKVRIEPLSRKHRKIAEGDAVIVRVEHEEHCKYETRLSWTEQISLPTLLGQIGLLIDMVRIQRALLAAGESQPPREEQLPLFSEETMSEVEMVNPFPAALRAMPRPLLLGRVIDALMSERDCTLEEVADAAYVDEDFIEALIAGELPDELIEDELLVDLADVLKVTPNTLRIILRRPVVHSVMAGHQEDAGIPEQFLDDIWDVLDDDDA